MAPRVTKAKKVEVTDKPKAIAKSRGRKNKEEEEFPDAEIKQVVEKNSEQKKGKKAQRTEVEEKEDAPPPKKPKVTKKKENGKGDNKEQSENNETSDNVKESKKGGQRKPADVNGKHSKEQSEEEEDSEKPKARRGRKPVDVNGDNKTKIKHSAEDDNTEKPKATRRRKPANANGEVKEQTNNTEEKEITEKPKAKRGRKLAELKGDDEEQTKDSVEKGIEKPKTKRGRKVVEVKGNDEKEKNHAEDAEELTSRPKDENDDEKNSISTEEDIEEPSTKRRRKPADTKGSPKVTKQKAPAKNKNSTEYETLDFSNFSKTDTGKEWNFKIASWNVDGIRAWMNKGGLEYLAHEKPDILCLQEVKCSKEKLPEEIANVPGYHAYWLCSDKDGYAGVGIYTTKLAMNVQYGLQNEELDGEGRIITAEYEAFYLICTYVPNAGRKLVTLPKRLQWNEEFRKYVKELDKKKPVIICGDMNVAHNEIDLSNPKTNKKNAGFTEEERSGMTDLLGDGFVDTFRHLNPDKTGAYTFWTYMMNSRAKNVGWRLDYFILSKRLLPSMSDSVIRDGVYGSDHCPITLFLNITSAEKPKE